MTESLGELAAAICNVMEDLGYVKATGINTQQGYTYTSDEDLLKALQPLLVKHGLVLMPVGFESETQRFQTAKGAPMWRSDVAVTYRLVHKSGESMTLQSGGAGTDSLDKDPYKALTGAYKYILRQTFAVPTGDDAERDQRTPSPKAKVEKRAAQNTASRPAKPETVKSWLVSKAAKSNSKDRISDKQLKYLTWKLHEACLPYESTPVLEYVFGASGYEELSRAQAGAMLDWLMDGSEYHPDALAEAKALAESQHDGAKLGYEDDLADEDIEWSGDDD